MGAFKTLAALLLLAIISTTASAITDDQVFAYAAANYPSLFSGTATAGQYQQYTYQYYPTSGNFLAVDNTGMIYILGPASGGVIEAVVTVASIANAITAWEQATTSQTDNLACSLYYVPGRVLTIDSTIIVPGILTHTSTSIQSLGADTIFLGQSVKQMVEQDSTETPATTKSTFIQDLSTEWIELGLTTVSSGISSTATFQPAIHTPKQWAIGQTETYTGQLVIAGNGNPSLNTAIQSTTSFVRRESVTVPAGTFETCLFHTDTTSSNIAGTVQGKSDMWIAPNVGEVKMVNTSGASTLTQILRQVQ